MVSGAFEDGFHGRSVVDGQAELQAHFTAFAVVALAQAAHGVADGAVLEVVHGGPGLQGQTLLAQPVFDLVGGGLLHGGCRSGWLLMDAIMGNLFPLSISVGNIFMGEPFADVGLRIKALRGALSLREFATKLGVDHKSVSGWEAGKRLPDGSSLLALMQAFGADINYILSGQPSQPVPPQALLPEGDRILLDNFHAAPPQVRDGVKTTLGAFAPGAGAASAKRGKAA